MTDILIKLEEYRKALDPARLSADIASDMISGVNRNYIDLTTKPAASEYDTESSIPRYRNFLNWLFATFKVDEFDFRRQCMMDLTLSPGDRVLVTSCGLGEDASVAKSLTGVGGVVHAQDLSRHFIENAAGKISDGATLFTISDALDLPYRDGYFDAVYHFGGINLFEDIPKAVFEMNRVCRTGGKIMFGDESVAPHLRDTDYGRMFIENNALWASHAPLQHLPEDAEDITLKYVLGNCFYLIGFTKGSALPDVDIDVEHEGCRGGSVRKRYFGKLEGVDPALREKVYDIARKENVSVSRILEDLIRKL